MARIGFIGLGNMGGPMAVNLIRAGHDVAAFDMAQVALDRVTGEGAKAMARSAECARGAEIVITMLPAGRHVRDVYVGAGDLIASAEPGALLIDCSTIDVATARDMSKAAADAGLGMVDAPVSGGVPGAEAATLTFMVGGAEADFARAEPILAVMGKTIVHAGGAGNGQAAKICNNMVLGVSMVGLCEAFVLAEKLGLDSQKLFDIASTASGQCWSLTSYCPVPGPVPASPANRNYAPGFTANMMLKDLKLAQEAAGAFDAVTPLGAGAAALYGLFVNGGAGEKDFSGLIEMLRGEGKE